MTNQELFDKVSTHLLTQNAKSIGMHSETGQIVCKYKNSAGLKCAIGCLIPDDKYDFTLEGLNVSHILIKEAAQIPPSAYDLAYDLQMCHDRNEVSNWLSVLKLIAQKYNLRFSYLECPT